MVEKSPNAFRTISEVSDALEVPAHVLRFWESKFNQIKPVKRGGGRRYYRPTDLDLIRGIRDLLYSEGLTIKGVQKVLREKGVRHVMEVGALEDVNAVNTEDEALWDEPSSTELEQRAEPDQDRLFEMAESAAPSPVKDAPPAEIKSDEPPRKAKPPKRVEPEPDIRSLFDDPPPSEAAKQAVAEDELITKVAKIAEVERGPEGVEAPADEPIEAKAEAKSGSDKKAEIKQVLGKLERLRDKMKSH